MDPPIPNIPEINEPINPIKKMVAIKLISVFPPSKKGTCCDSLIDHLEFFCKTTFSSDFFIEPPNYLVQFPFPAVSLRRD